MTSGHLSDLRAPGQGKAESRSYLRRTPGEDGATMPGDGSPHAGQAHAASLELAAFVEPLKHPEQPVLTQRIEADAVTTHENHSFLRAFLGPDLDVRLLLPLAEFQGVGKQVDQHQLQGVVIARHGR